MYKSKKKIFDYYEEVDIEVIKKLKVPKTLREKVKKLINNIPYGEVEVMENPFRRESNPKHENLCLYLKDIFEKNGFTFKEHVLFSYRPYSCNRKKNLRSYDIVEPDFLVYCNKNCAVVEVKSSNSEENLKKGFEQLFLTDVLIRYYPEKFGSFININPELYLVIKGNIYFTPYKITEEVKSKIYEGLVNYIVNTTKKRKNYEKDKFVKDLISILGLIKERI